MLGVKVGRVERTIIGLSAHARLRCNLKGSATLTPNVGAADIIRDYTPIHGQHFHLSVVVTHRSLNAHMLLDKTCHLSKTRTLCVDIIKFILGPISEGYLRL